MREIEICIMLKAIFIFIDPIAHMIVSKNAITKEIYENWSESNYVDSVFTANLRLIHGEFKRYMNCQSNLERTTRVLLDQNSNRYAEKRQVHTTNVTFNDEVNELV